MSLFILLYIFHVHLVFFFNVSDFAINQLILFAKTRAEALTVPWISNKSTITVYSSVILNTWNVWKLRILNIVVYQTCDIMRTSIGNGSTHLGYKGGGNAILWLPSNVFFSTDFFLKTFHIYKHTNMDSGLQNSSGTLMLTTGNPQLTNTTV